MQQYSLLQTKLYIPPTRPELISRPRLIERLNAGLPTRGGLSRTQDAFPRALTLSFDHDIIDGAPAARFTERFKDLIENAYGLTEQDVGAGEA